MVTSVVLPAPLATRLITALGNDVAVLSGVWSDETLHIVGSMQGPKVDATAGECLLLIMVAVGLTTQLLILQLQTRSTMPSLGVWTSLG